MRSILLASALALTACSDDDTSAASRSTAAATTPASDAPKPTDKGRKAKNSTRKARKAKVTGGVGQAAHGKSPSGNADHGTAPAGVHTVGQPSKVERDAGMVARCSDGQVVFGFWQGEYPSPIVQLDKQVQVDVLDDPCGGPARGCALKAGLLHPWATPGQKSGQQAFGTRTRTVAYTLLQDHSLAGETLPKGSKVEVLSYLSEGLCAMHSNGRMLEDMCPGTGAKDDAIWKAEGDPNPPATQLVEVACQGGPSGWLVVDPALLGRKDVREGQMRGYGEIDRSR